MAELACCILTDRRTDQQIDGGTDMTKAIVAFSNFPNMSENHRWGTRFCGKVISK